VHNTIRNKKERGVQACKLNRKGGVVVEKGCVPRVTIIIYCVMTEFVFIMILRLKKFHHKTSINIAKEISHECFFFNTNYFVDYFLFLSPTPLTHSSLTRTVSSGTIFSFTTIYKSHRDIMRLFLLFVISNKRFHSPRELLKCYVRQKSICLLSS
jgi:hypothetical protein